MMLGRGLQNRNHSKLLVMTRLILTLVLSLVLKNSAIAKNEYDAIFEELQDKYDVEKGDEWNLDKQVSVIEKYSRKNPNIFVADDFRGRVIEEAKNAAKAGANLPLEQSDVVGVWISCRRESGEAIIINGKYTYQLFNKKGVFLIAMGRTVDEAFGNMTSDIRSGRIMTGTYSISGSKVTMIDSEGTLVHDYSNQYGGFLTFKNTSGALRFHEVPSWMR